MTQHRDAPASSRPENRAESPAGGPTNGPTSGSPGGPTGRAHSTRHYKLDVYRAEILARHFPSLTAVEIRECLEGTPLKQAVALICWAERKCPANPRRPLLNWARKHRRGFYSPEVRCGYPAGHEQRECGEYLRRKDAGMRRRAGRPLTGREREQLARLYHAPRYRAETREAAGLDSAA